MSSTSQSLGARLELAIGRALALLPPAVDRRLAGEPIEVDGQILHYEAQASLQSARRLGLDRIATDPVEDRARTARSARLAHGKTFRVGAVEEHVVAGAAGDLPARLYVPDQAPAAGPLLVYFHGGGFVVGDLDTHDQLCRLICAEAETRVLSVAYRLAPEHPFPAAVDDACASFLAVAADPASFGAAPGSIAVGGDSAGGNLALNVSISARDAGEQPPAYQALIYPVSDRSRRRRSHELFGEGFYLTVERFEGWMAQYGSDQRTKDPRVSPLLVEDVSGLPPTDLLTVGFDPLRDEGLELADRLREAGVAVEQQLAPDIFHGYVNAAGVSRRARDVLTDFARGLPVGAREAVSL